MQLGKLYTDERAVSPVIGVILMIAITTILAAVVGAFALGLAGNVMQTSPQVEFTFENGNLDDTDSSEDVRIRHQEGQSVETATLEIAWADTTVTWEDASAGDSPPKVTAGSQVLIGDGKPNTDTTGSNLPGSTVRIIWTSERGDMSATLATYQVPEN